MDGRLVSRGIAAPPPAHCRRWPLPSAGPLFGHVRRGYGRFFDIISMGAKFASLREIRGPKSPVIKVGQSQSKLKTMGGGREHWRAVGVRGHDRALELDDMSSSPKAATCRRTPKPRRPLAGSNVRRSRTAQGQTQR